MFGLPGAVLPVAFAGMYRLAPDAFCRRFVVLDAVVDAGAESENGRLELTSVGSVAARFLS